ncbi:MAG: membrane protein insertase YidC [Bacteroidetes bacterium CG02_land_8_20_14_3_00_31_25]|nr:MAG: membrane protein insertase YidC [Bacteroidetes bacterium CG02_land_8_20_14_3_00_31_25]
MDKNTVIGIILIVVIFGIFAWVNQPSEVEIAKAKQQRDSIEKVINDSLKTVALQQSTVENSVPTLTSNDSASQVLPDSLIEKKNEDIYGDFSKAAEGTTKFITLENNKIKIKFSTLGGRPYSVELKEYKTYDSLPLILFDGDSTVFGLNFFSQNKSISTNNLFFEPNTSDSLLKAVQSSQKITMRLNAGKGQYLEFVYELPPNSYKMKFRINTIGFDKVITNNANFMSLNWDIFVSQQEKGKDFENSYTTVYYKYLDDEVDYLSETKDSKEDLRTKVKWLAFKQQFFSAVLMANDFFLSATVSSNKYIGSQKRLIKIFKSEITIPFDRKPSESRDLTFYFGPNHYNTLAKQEMPDLEKLVPLGWGIFGWINRFAVIPIFNFLGGFIASYGLIIFLLTLIIKLVLFPLTYKSYLSTAKMKVLKPQIDEINARIPKDKTMERQQATMALYKKVGVNPLGGCLPMALQMPILFAMFRFFPASIELRQKSFLWATDLSSYDSVWNFGYDIPFYGDHVSLFCLLMTASTIIYTYQQNKMNPQSTSIPGMKVMMYLMPVMFLFMFNSYASGLSYYYLLANLFTFAQMYFIRRFVDEKAILAKLNENKKNPVKKSKFQERLELMAKQRKLKK